MIPQETIEQVAAANDIVEVIGSIRAAEKARRGELHGAVPVPPGKSPVVQRQSVAAEFQMLRVRRGRDGVQVHHDVREHRISRRRAPAGRAGRHPHHRGTMGPPRRGPWRGGAAPTPARAPRGGGRMVPPQPDEKPGGTGRARLPQVARVDSAGSRGELEDRLRAGCLGSLPASWAAERGYNAGGSRPERSRSRMEQRQRGHAARAGAPRTTVSVTG